MISTVFAHDGTCVFSGTWTAIIAARSFNSNLLNIPDAATHFIRYKTGATHVLVVGETLTGGTSNETCTLVAQAVENGTAGAGDTGILFVKDVSGAFQAETLTGDATGTVAILQDLIPIIVSSRKPKSALVVVETASLNVTVGGVLATTTAVNNDGITMTSGQSRVLRGFQDIASFQAINAVNANGGVLKYEIRY